MLRIWIKTDTLSDRSHAHSVIMRTEDGAEIELPAITMNDAATLATIIGDAIELHTNCEVETRL